MENAAIVISDPETLTDRQLFEAAQRIGALALKSRREFIGLLPLIERRRVYEGRMFYSIYDFAAKVGGIGREVVTEVMRLDAQLRELPLVRKLLYSGKVGWSKIRMVTAWLSVDNQKEWIEKLENLSNRALQVYLRDYHSQLEKENIIELFPERSSFLLTPEVFSIKPSNFEKTAENKAENFGAEISEYNRNISESQTPPAYILPPPPSKLTHLAHQRETFTFSLQSDIAVRLRLFRQKLEKDRRELITWEEVMVEFLKMIESEMEYKEKKKSEEALKKEQEKIRQAEEISKQKSATRYIPAHIRHIVDQQYSGLCAFRDCKQPATIYHHTRRFALSNKGDSQAEVHDPRFIKPLCEPHERIIHNTLIENEDIDPATWKVLDTPDTASSRHEIDRQVMEYRKPQS